MNNTILPASTDIDLPRLRAARSALDLQILALKRVLRVRWSVPCPTNSAPSCAASTRPPSSASSAPGCAAAGTSPTTIRCVEVCARLAPGFQRAAEAAA